MVIFEKMLRNINTIITTSAIEAEGQLIEEIFRNKTTLNLGQMMSHSFLAKAQNVVQSYRKKDFVISEKNINLTKMLLNLPPISEQCVSPQ